ncbi:MAG: SurA N-terminal domain-containing protein [Parvularcula sp.]|nr:SurA N-terminal domain-containing protein [Parvularcula sp.]
MLNQVRDSLRGVVAWVIGVLIILAMAVVGVPALDNFGGTSALTVGSTEYSARDVEVELRNRIQAAQLENPGLTREQALASGLTQQTLQTLVVRGLINEEADRLGMAAPDEVVREYLQSIEAFKDPDTGRFDSSRLSQYLSQQGIGLQTFSATIGDEVKRSQIAQALGAGSPAPQQLARFLLLREVEGRDIAVGKLALSDLPEPSEAELASYLATNIDDYQSPEYRTYTVLTIDTEEVASEIEVSEDELNQLYEARRGAGAAAETRTFRQIRLATDDDLAEAERMVEEGATFEDIAAALSAEVTTLGEQTRSDIIVDEFAEAIFAAEVGELVGPVATPFGALLAEVRDVSASETESFDAMRGELEAELRAEIAEERLVELVESVEIARDEGATLAEAAQAIGREARTTQPADRELFTRSGSIVNVPVALAAEGLRLEEGEESSAIRLESGYGFIGVERIYPSAPLPLEDVREDVLRAVRNEARQDAANRLLAEVQSAEASGVTFEQAIADLGGETQQLSFALRQPPEGVPPALVGRSFDLPVGEVGAFSASSEGEEVVYLIKPTAVRFEDVDQLEAVLPLVSGQFAQQLGSELGESYLNALEEITEVKQNERQMARALGQDTQ